MDWGFSWSLFGNSSLLDGADIPDDAAIWNQFHPKTILATFRDTALGRSAGFQAVISSFELVPEPGTAVLTLTAVFVVAVFLDRRKKRS
jgi:hypothetical protein